MSSYAPLLILAMITGCGSDSNPMSADDAGAIHPGDVSPTLVGTWYYAGQSFTEKMTSNVTDYLVGKGVADSTAAEIASQVVDAAAIVYLPSITFNADSTLTLGDSAGQTNGTWSVVEDTLTMMIEGVEYPPFSYTIRSGQSLSLQLSISAQVVRGLIEVSEAIDQELLDVMFRGIAQLTFGYNQTK